MAGNAEEPTKSGHIWGEPLFFKWEYHGERYQLSHLTTKSTIGDLRAYVCKLCKISDYRKIILKTLQPTAIIDASDASKPLSEIFHQARTRIVVEDVPLPPGASTSGRHGLSASFSRPNLKHHKSDTSDLDDKPLAVQSNLDFGVYESLVSESKDQANPNLTASATSNESPARQRKLPRDQFVDYPVCSSTGYLLRHPVPSNNSCLFTSVHFCLTNGIVEDQIGKSMRKIIAETVASDRERFDEAFLGKPNADYCKWILDDNNWGGAIELSILCKYYETEIVAIDVKNTLLNKFGEDSHYPQRMLLLYDGIHYDPLKFQPLEDNQPIQTLFSTENIELLTLALELAKEAKQSHQFTDVGSIAMKCSTCGAEFDTKSASEHANKTGHVDFVEKN